MIVSMRDFNGVILMVSHSIKFPRNLTQKCDLSGAAFLFSLSSILVVFIQ